MPELPEVETVCRGIQSINNKNLTRVVIRNHKLRVQIPDNFIALVKGQKVKSITRRAKYIVLELNDGFILIHLGMTGSIRLLPKNDSTMIKKHDHVDLIFGEVTLRYNDPRRFGLILYYKTLNECNLLEHLGPEPLSDQFNVDYFISKLENRSTTIKQLIMDNTVVVGVGNIYACEALFLAKISPLKKSSTLTKNQATDLIKRIREVLTQAIELGGSSLRDYKQVNGELGYFQNIHNVYGRAKQSCKYCNGIILEHRLGQRNSFYCPNCQL